MALTLIYIVISITAIAAALGYGVIAGGLVNPEGPFEKRVICDPTAIEVNGECTCKNKDDVALVVAGKLTCSSDSSIPIPDLCNNRTEDEECLDEGEWTGLNP